jgi:hypothetical protein
MQCRGSLGLNFVGLDITGYGTVPIGFAMDKKLKIRGQMAGTCIPDWPLTLLTR